MASPGNVGMPQTTISDVGFTVGGPSGFPQGRDTTTGVLSDTVTMLKGKHQIKWGGEFRRYLLYSFAGNIGSMTLTSANLAADVTPVFSIQPNIIDYRIYADAAAAFVQDNYRIKPGLTLEGRPSLRVERNAGRRRKPHRDLQPRHCHAHPGRHQRHSGQWSLQAELQLRAAPRLCLRSLQ